MKKIFFALAAFTVIFLSSCTVGYVGARPEYGVDVAVGTAPGPDYYWVNREYAWRNGAYVAVPGYWARRPYAGAVWTQGHWHRHSGNYRWEGGHWD